MSETKANAKPPVWFWIVAVLLLLWNLVGLTAFVGQVAAGDAAIDAMPADQQEWARSIPGWIMIVFGVAVSTGVIGSLGLLMRKAWTTLVWSISLIAVLVQMTYTMVIAGGLQVLADTDKILPAAVVLIAALSVGFAFLGQRKGWLQTA